MKNDNVKFRNKYLYLKLLICVIIFFKILGIFFLGTFGLRNKTQGCGGLTLSYETVSKYFPEGEINIGLLNFRYFVPKKSEIRKDLEENCSASGWCVPQAYNVNMAREYCLGQDVWIGE